MNNHNHNHKNNGIINFKELKKNWDKNIILSLIVVSSFMVGIFTGSVNWEQTYSGAYHSHPQPPEVSDVVMDPAVTETVETEMTTNADWGYVFPRNAQDIQFQFEGKSINQSVRVEHFECSIDYGKFSHCHSPREFNNLGVGEHVFEVRAVDNNGNVDHTPFSWVWSVK